jgi:hypothetical protein
MATSPDAAISSVTPSGGDFATAPAATMPLAPVRFSTMTDCPSADFIGSPSSLATRSTPPPAG